MDIIDYLLYENSHKDFVSSLIMLFGKTDVIAAHYLGVITITETRDPEYSTAKLNIH